MARSSIASSAAAAAVLVAVGAVAYVGHWRGEPPSPEVEPTPAPIMCPEKVPSGVSGDVIVSCD